MSKFKNWFMLGLGLLVIILFFNFLRGSGFMEVLMQANWKLVLLGIFFNLVIIGFWTLRWDVVLRKMGYKFNYIWLYLTTIVANFGDTISPGMRIGGEPFRAHFLQKKYEKVRGDDVAASLVLERVYNSSVFFLIAMISILFVIFKYAFSFKLHVPLIIILVLASFLMATMYYFICRVKTGIKIFDKIIEFTIEKLSKSRFWARIRKKYGSQKKMENYFDQHMRRFFQDIAKFVKEKWLWTEGGVISILYWLAIFGQAYIFFLAIGTKISFFTVVVIIAISNISGLVTFLPSGMGVTEMIQTALCVLFTVPLGNAAAAVLLIRGNYYFFGIIFGYLTMLAMTKGKGRKAIKIK